MLKLGHMKSAFTPALIYRKHRRKAQALFLVFALTPLVIYQSTINVSATDTTTWNSTNFAGGTKVNTEVKGGAISLPVTASTTDSNYNDFNYGDVNTNPFALVENLLGAGLEINQGYSYTNFTKLALPSKVVHHSFLNNGFLYVSTGNGLAVVDTKGTIDPSDDTLVTIYDSGSTPLLGGIDVNNTFLDNNILYVSTSDGGLSTINTQGTITPSDDTLVTTYNTTSVPALGGNRVYSAHIEGSLLYVNAFGGLAVINTQGTFTDASDDTLVVNYSTGSVPALVSNDVFSSFKVGNLLYTGVWGGGLYVIDTKGTVSVADDAIAARYYSGNIPALVNDNAQYAFLNNNLLYIGNWGGGLHVFDTKGTATSSDDTLITTYNTASTPALSGNHGFGAWLVNDLLYVGSYGGLTVIDTKGTTGPGDDTLAKIYNVSTDPKISGNTISSIFFDSDNLFISNNGGLSVLTPNKYYTPGTYISSARPIASTPTTTITMSASTTVGQNVGMSYRTCNNNAVWQDDFNDNNASEYLGDFYGWGEPFQTAVESGGTMKLSDPQAYNCCGGGSYVDFWLDTGFPDNHTNRYVVVLCCYLYELEQ